MPEDPDLVLRVTTAIAQTRDLRVEVDALRQDAVRNAAQLRRQRQRIAQAALLLAAWTLVEGYLFISIHEVYRDRCDTPAAGETIPGWCAQVFLFDRDEPAGHIHPDDGGPPWTKPTTTG